MPCYFPIQGIFRRDPITFKQPFVFDAHAHACFLEGRKPREEFLRDNDRYGAIPCGRCSGCRLERSRQWAIRCCNEAKMYQDNAFLTLTYAPECLPEGGTLVRKDMQDFWKRYRKVYGAGIRYLY